MFFFNTLLYVAEKNAPLYKTKTEGKVLICIHATFNCNLLMLFF